MNSTVFVGVGVEDFLEGNNLFYLVLKGIKSNLTFPLKVFQPRISLTNTKNPVSAPHFCARGDVHGHLELRGTRGNKRVFNVRCLKEINTEFEQSLKSICVF